ncbi:DUF4209 domain-containing protein [Cupriavidus sp. AcVe19-6a]|uniref:DUF4209 domain-containing protein n=1 Tax=Cupriavidus sp. AcVe19-6a TaxID=2821358 RepID=UPI001AE737E2|nr:DUF4209 domain-containing protein [Cupriavidus sp. AcVe19-6a]MBP0634874.1 DUF4209 domain-containing protein [Cupriavidus sp. AcVe19-6a]
MSNEEPLDKADLADSAWEGLFHEAGHVNGTPRWQALSVASKAAEDEGRHKAAIVLRLLGDACSMMLRPSANAEPFGPVLVIDNHRSPALSDFSERDLDFFELIAPDLPDAWLQARLADVVWSRRRKPDFALIAIDAYSKLPIDLESWVSGSQECYERALRLCISLRKSGAERLTRILASLSGSITKSEYAEDFLACQIASTLRRCKVGRDHAEEIAQALKDHGEADLKPAAHYRARGYFEEAAAWARLANLSLLHTEMLARIGETLVSEGDQRLAGAHPSAMAAAHFYERAIQAYREIPKKARDKFHVTSRIDALHKKVAEAGAAALDEMGTISGPPIDIAKWIQEAEQSVTGKHPEEALAQLCRLAPIAKSGELREQAEKMLRESPMQAIVGATYYSQDGRVIAKQSPLSFDGGPEEEAAIFEKMMWLHRMNIELHLQSAILPALAVIRAEHPLTWADFAFVVRQSGLVSRDYVGAFSKMLLAGFEGDFLTSTYIAAPQMESFVRFHLKAAGGQTTVINQDGIETEVGLSTLVSMPEMTKVFPADLIFEVRALFCEATGPNLRNEIAHGLLPDESCASYGAIYAWWLMLRLVFIPFWNKARPPQ